MTIKGKSGGMSWVLWNVLRKRPGNVLEPRRDTTQSIVPKELLLKIWELEI
jgi:hypothetical protein